jgi:hypothetical protein
MPFEQLNCQEKCPYKDLSEFENLKSECRGLRVSIVEWEPYYEDGQVIGELAKKACGSIKGPDKDVPSITIQDWADTPLTPTELKSLYDQGLLADQALDKG